MCMCMYERYGGSDSTLRTLNVFPFSSLKLDLNSPSELTGSKYHDTYIVNCFLVLGAVFCAFFCSSTTKVGHKTLFFFAGSESLAIESLVYEEAEEHFTKVVDQSLMVQRVERGN
ncbi:hypothetical protein KEM48_006351 [Puccinia striiformis f. sp. tritici PST-130]|nr:hypothetical protein KEM48_006351 [Puccinia striiformis f. sp. tritici PST-130]